MPSLICFLARLYSLSRTGSEITTPPVIAWVITPRFMPHALQNFAPSIAWIEQPGQNIRFLLRFLIWGKLPGQGATQSACQILARGVSARGGTRGSIA